MRGLKDRVVFVTGGASGIGRAVAIRLSEEGAKVAVADLNCDGARTVADEVRGHPLTVDVTDLDAVRSAVDEAASVLGPIDGLVNCAGWTTIKPFVETNGDMWRRAIDVNLVGTINVVRAVLDGMTERKRGSIVLVSSDAGRVGSGGEAVYSGAKAGVIGFAKAIAREVSRHGIRVNVVCPGPTDTPMMAAASEESARRTEAILKAIPFRRLGSPEELAAAIVFLASEDASYITGQTLSVNGGLSMV